MLNSVFFIAILCAFSRAYEIKLAMEQGEWSTVMTLFEKLSPEYKNDNLFKEFISIINKNVK